MLVRAGVDDVKVDRLARELSVTRGSFYYHFADRQDLLDALLDDWEANNQKELSELAKYLEQATPDLSDIFRLWLSEDPTFPSFDMAIRVWARKATKIAKVVHRVDEAWIDLFKQFFVSNGVSDIESFVRARVMYFHQVGYYALSIDEGLDERIRLTPYYYKVLTGSEPSAPLAEALSKIKRPVQARS